MTNGEISKPRSELTDPRGFEHLFAPPVIRAMLDWQAIRDGRCTVEVFIPRDRRTLESWYTVWYLDDTGMEVGCMSPAAVRPLSLAELRRRPFVLAPSRLDWIARLADASQREPSPMIVAVYHIQGDEHVIVDGNHRLAAVVLHRLPVRIMAFVLKGPVDRSILPDLAWFEGGAEDPSNPRRTFPRTPFATSGAFGQARA